MSKYIETPAYYDRMPVDISFVFEEEKPAGKHGFLRADGDIFRFEDGTPVKFWGVIFNGAANFPEHAYSEKVARRLAQAGCNLVRLHQLDAEWATPNIYRMTAGKRLVDTRHLCDEALERLDYLIYCLKEQGIYVCVDMLTFRKFKSGDGVKYADQLFDLARAYSMFDPVMIDLQMEFCTKFWNHYNPYTRCAYKDDPAFVMCTIINENDIFNNPGRRKDYRQIPYYEDVFRKQFSQWLQEQNIDYDAFSCSMYTKDEPMIEFKLYLTRRYYTRMREHLRELGVKIPITGTNWLHTDAMVEASACMDFTDMHRYIYDWHWGETEKVTFNKAITDCDSLIAPMAKAKIANKPVFFSEWDIPWPNAYRALGAPYFAAISCLQNWMGMVVHTYAYGTNLQYVDRIGKECSASTIGGVPYREGIFSVWNDPAKFGLFYHSALMVRRGDVRPAEKTVGVTITDRKKFNLAAVQSLIEMHRVCTVMDPAGAEGVDEIVPDNVKIPKPEAKKTRADTGELWRDFNRSVAVIDSPRTKIAYGFIGRGGADQAVRGDLAINLDGMQVDCRTDFGVVAVSSLTDRPIMDSDNMLLSAIGRARNTGAQFDGEKLLDFGHAPIMSEVIRATIRIHTEKPNLRVWGISSEGYYVGMLDTTYEDGWLEFTIGETYPALYYLILEE